MKTYSAPVYSCYNLHKLLSQVALNNSNPQKDSAKFMFCASNAQEQIRQLGKSQGEIASTYFREM